MQLSARTQMKLALENVRYFDNPRWLLLTTDAVPFTGDMTKNGYCFLPPGQC
jgi:hypothetical protein